MDGIKYAIFTDKSTRLLGKNQYTSNVESRSTRTNIKHWVELFFGVKEIAMNSHRLSGKRYILPKIMYIGNSVSLELFKLVLILFLKIGAEEMARGHSKDQESSPSSFKTRVFHKTPSTQVHTCFFPAAL